jgi:hypothetical protein
MINNGTGFYLELAKDRLRYNRVTLKRNKIIARVLPAIRTIITIFLIFAYSSIVTQGNLPQEVPMLLMLWGTILFASTLREAVIAQSYQKIKLASFLIRKAEKIRELEPEIDSTIEDNTKVKPLIQLSILSIGVYVFNYTTLLPTEWNNIFNIAFLVVSIMELISLTLLTIRTRLVTKVIKDHFEEKTYAPETIQQEIEILSGMKITPTQQN